MGTTNNSMKISEQLRAGARYMREHGFSPCIRGCFIGVTRLANGPGNLNACRDFLGRLIFDETDSNYLYWAADESLVDQGWNTDDAVAAMEIAADVAESEGK